MPTQTLSRRRFLKAAGLTVAGVATIVVSGGDPAITDVAGWLWALALGPLPAVIAGGWAVLRSPRILMSGFAVAHPTPVAWGTPGARAAAAASAPPGSSSANAAHDTRRSTASLPKASGGCG